MKRGLFLLSTLSAIVGAAAVGPQAGAEGRSVSPYIDQIKKEMSDKDGAEISPPAPVGAPDPYIQSLKKGIPDDGSSTSDSRGYTDRLKKELPPQSSSSSYTEQLKGGVAPKIEGGAIDAVNQGRSTLHPKMDERISGSGGFRYGASLSRDITAVPGVSYQPFNTIYGANYAPDVSLFYEYQPWHSEWLGNVGVVASFGVGYFHGNGIFALSLRNAAAPSGTSFPSTSQTLFQFFTLPITLGLDYRFNLFRIVRPFIEAGPTLIGYVEMRNDPVSGHRGYSQGVYGLLGASLLLDWLNPSSSWDAYATNGIRHTYLTVEYRRQQTIASDVSFNVSGVDAGVTFEF